MILRKNFLVISYHVTAVVRLVIGILNNHVEDGGTENVAHLKKTVETLSRLFRPALFVKCGRILILELKSQGLYPG